MPHSRQSRYEQRVRSANSTILCDGTIFHPRNTNRMQSFPWGCRQICRGSTGRVQSHFREKIGPFILRLALGIVCVYHGFAKIQANGGTNWCTELGLGWQLAISWGEFSGGLAIIVGLYCRWAAGVILFVSVGTLAWFKE